MNILTIYGYKIPWCTITKWKCLFTSNVYIFDNSYKYCGYSSFNDVSIFHKLHGSCFSAYLIHIKIIICAIFLKMLLNLDYICIKILEHPYKILFKYTNFRQNIDHTIRGKWHITKTGLCVCNLSSSF